MYYFCHWSFLFPQRTGEALLMFATEERVIFQIFLTHHPKPITHYFFCHFRATKFKSRLLSIFLLNAYWFLNCRTWTAEHGLLFCHFLHTHTPNYVRWRTIKLHLSLTHSHFRSRQAYSHCHDHVISYICGLWYTLHITTCNPELYIIHPDNKDIHFRITLLVSRFLRISIFVHFRSPDKCIHNAPPFISFFTQNCTTSLHHPVVTHYIYFATFLSEKFFGKSPMDYLPPHAMTSEPQ